MAYQYLQQHIDFLLLLAYLEKKPSDGSMLGDEKEALSER
jgi:hypothetical protein